MVATVRIASELAVIVQSYSPGGAHYILTSSTLLLWPTPAKVPNGNSIGSVAFRAHGREQHTDRHTDRQRYVRHLLQLLASSSAGDAV